MGAANPRQQIARDDRALAASNNVAGDGRCAGSILGVACLVVFLSAARAADVTFQPAGGEWSDPANWVGGEFPGSGDVAVFGATGGLSTFYMGGNREVAGLRFSKTGESLFYGSSDTEASFSTLTLGAEGIFVSDASSGFVFLGSVSNSVAPPLHQQIAITLTADQTWTNNRASTLSQTETLFRGLTSAGVVDNLGARTLTITGSGWTELRGRTEGTADSRIIKEGVGVLALASDMGSGFLGNIEVREGSLGVGNGPNVLGRGVLEIEGGQIFPYLGTRAIGNDMIWSGNFSVRDPRRDFQSFPATSLTISGSTLLTDDVTVTVSNNGSLGSVGTFSVGPIGDGGNGFGVTKAGPGPLEFLGDNTYTGPTTVTTGTLRLGTGGATGSVAGDIVLTAAATRLEINRSAPLVYDGVISGSGSIVKTGAGGLTLTGANTYTGTLTVNGGALGVNSVESLPGWDTAGRYSVGAAAGITFGNNVIPEQIETIFNTGNVDAAAGSGFDTTAGNRTFSANLATVFPGRSVFKTGPNTLILDGQSTNTTAFTIGGGSVRVASAQDGDTSGPLGLGSIVFAGGALQYSAANATDYSPRFTDATQVYAADTNGRDVTWGRTFSVGDGGGIAKSGAGTLTLSNTVTMAASGLAASEGTLVVSGLTLTSGAGVVLDVTGGGRLEVGGTVQRDTSTRPILITGDGEVDFTSTGRVENVGNSTLRVSGGATVLFSNGRNTFSSQIFVEDGVIVGVELRNQNANSSFGNPSNANRQVFVLGNAATFGTLRYIGVGDSSNRQIQIGSGSGGGGAGIENNGTGALTLSGSAGWYNVQDTNATAARTLTLSGANADANTISAGIRDNSGPVGTVSVVKAGSGVWVLSGANEYTGNTTISQGILGIGSTGALPGWNVAGRYSVAAGAGLAVGNAVTDANVTTMLATGNFAPGSGIGFDTTTANRTFSGSVTGNRGLVKIGANTLILTGANDPEAGTAISGGVLQVGNGGAVGSLAGDVNVLGPGTLAFNRSDDITLTNAISGGGTLRQAGTGRLTLSIANPSFSGELRAPAGTVRVTNGAALGTAQIIPGGSGDLGTVELEGGISLPNGLTVGGRSDSNLNFSVRNVSGTNSITGNVSITGGGSNYRLESQAGLLRLTGDWGAIGGVVPGTSRTITLDGAGDFDIAGAIPVQGTTAFSFTKNGAGTVFFSGSRDMAGNTTVSAGRMTMNPGSVFTNRAGIVTIASGATLAGAGTIANLVTINGIHSPGASPGVQTFTNDLIYAATGSLVWELSGNTADTADRGTVYDGVDVTGDGGKLKIDPAATLALVFDAPFANNDPSSVNFTNPFWSEDRTWQVIALTNDATWDGTPTAFGTILVGEDAFGNSLAGARPQASFSLLAQNDGVFLVYTAVPEPSAFVLGLGGVALLGLAARIRRRQG
jgi:autotransporter-associated beta strand protein